MKKILIINLKHLGDVLTSTPLLPALKNHFPGSKIFYLVRAGMEPMVEDHPLVHHIFVLDQSTSGFWARSAYHLNFLARLRRERFDVVLELSRGDRGAFLAFASGAPVRVGYNPGGEGFLGRSRLFTHLVQSKVTEKHTIEFHLDAVRALGIEIPGKQMSFHWSTADEENADRLLRGCGIAADEPFVAMHPTSRWMFKTWTVEGYAEVADHIRERHGLKVVVTSGPEQKERDKVKRILSLVRQPLADLSGRLTLKQLGRVIQRALLFFGVDSAPMHMAVAVNTPVVVLFGPSGEHMWGPLGDQDQVITLPVDCRPCGRDGCDGSKQSRCLLDISPSKVIYHIDEKITELNT